MQENAAGTHPLMQLDEADREFVCRLVLSSGSLKEVAQSYGVSYPTIRLMMDRVIGRLKRATEGRRVDPVLELVAELVEKGELTVGAARRLQTQYRKSKSVAE